MKIKIIYNLQHNLLHWFKRYYNRLLHKDNCHHLILFNSRTHLRHKSWIKIKAPISFNLHLQIITNKFDREMSLLFFIVCVNILMMILLMILVQIVLLFRIIILVQFSIMIPFLPQIIKLISMMMNLYKILLCIVVILLHLIIIIITYRLNEDVFLDVFHQTLSRFYALFSHHYYLTILLVYLSSSLY